ncbi:MAG: hypothetical protein HN742_41375 [Lentisphaerae bacterium]|jgi:hypothetical protein|nr:hypothetical protein [Lentisphaerota bacterium]MBT4817476.1 hypothetical protein [Lentisphaerota bacterium]MBT5612741.1 hypothetical protein [Lentisphaerota bacterium]MBT7058970.1 hypothetical protein [Lentisphaerota bacterium]MBT7848390.1 hypothetical protein [Lentisphaerota bacterium]
MDDRDKIWYAARATQVVSSPKKVLETFGATAIQYHLLSDLLDDVGKVRIRRGKIVAERPQVITPSYYINQALENFGKEAEQYIEGLRHTAAGMRFLQYGLKFRKEEHSEEVVQGDIGEVADQVSADVHRDDGTLSAVLIGVDDLWEICLLKFVGDVVQTSAPHNFRELSDRGLLDSSDGHVPNAVRVEIESDFRAAQGHYDQTQLLGQKLKKYGLFEQYEDRFYALLRAAKR